MRCRSHSSTRIWIFSPESRRAASSRSEIIRSQRSTASTMRWAQLRTLSTCSGVRPIRPADALAAEAPLDGRGLEMRHRLVADASLLRIEHREVLPYRLFRRVLLHALRAGVPAGDVALRRYREDGVVPHRLDELGEPLLLEG